MTAYAGIPRKREMSPIPVSLTRKGYPRPSFHRRMMYVKDEKANQLVKIFLFSNNMIRPFTKTYRSPLPTLTESIASKVDKFHILLKSQAKEAHIPTLLSPYR